MCSLGNCVFFASLCGGIGGYSHYFSLPTHCCDYKNFFEEIFTLRILVKNVKNISSKYFVYFISDDYFTDFAVFWGGMDSANGCCLGDSWNYDVYNSCGWTYYDSRFYFRNEKFI